MEANINKEISVEPAADGSKDDEARATLRKKFTAELTGDFINQVCDIVAENVPSLW